MIPTYLFKQIVPDTILRSIWSIEILLLIQDFFYLYNNYALYVGTQHRISTL